MCSRNVKRPARGARPARAAGCRLKGARSVSPAPHPASHRGGREPRQQRVTRASGAGTSWQAKAVSRPCAGRTGRTHHLQRNGTDQASCPCRIAPGRWLAAVARHPFDVRAVTDRGVPRPPVRSIARWQWTRPEGLRAPAGPAPSRPHRRPVGTQGARYRAGIAGRREAATRAASRQNYLIKRGRPRPGGRAGVAARSRSGCGRQNRLPEKHRCK